MIHWLMLKNEPTMKSVFEFGANSATWFSNTQSLNAGIVNYCTQLLIVKIRMVMQKKILCCCISIICIVCVCGVHVCVSLKSV